MFAGHIYLYRQSICVSVSSSAEWFLFSVSLGYNLLLVSTLLTNDVIIEEKSDNMQANIGLVCFF